ncbi:MAG: hypothetical protein ACXAC8_16875 [Candidatus Hodarchaeales archaeon]
MFIQIQKLFYGTLPLLENQSHYKGCRRAGIELKSGFSNYSIYY